MKCEYTWYIWDDGTVNIYPKNYLSKLKGVHHYKIAPGISPLTLVARLLLKGYTANSSLNVVNAIRISPKEQP